jgi:hypothetical protein
MNLTIHLRILMMGLALFFVLGADTGDTGEGGDGSSSGGCGESPPPILQDPSFDLWCGDELCSWEVEDGAIEQVPTWHAGDHGVGMISDPTVLTQRSEASDQDTDCIWFTLMVDSDPGVTVTLELDFRDDGLTEYAHPIPSTDWTTFSYHIRPPSYFDNIRFRIRKTGAGQATLAQIAADRANASLCASQAPLIYEDLPLGARCQDADECASSHCTFTRVMASSRELDGDYHASCSECSIDSDCSDEQVCGMAYTAENRPYTRCVDPATRQLGEQCHSGGECGSGVCCEGRCSECCGTADSGCDEGESCQHAAGNGDGSTRMMPSMCEPGSGERAEGAACLADDDCASDRCEASAQLKLCDPSGQPCDSDEDCPSFDGEPARCATMGALGGMCRG